MVSATIGYVRSENFAYPACAMEGCAKKAIENGDSWRCEKCDREFPAPEYRYTLKVSMMDHTGTAWLSMFNDQAQRILGMPAGDLIQLKVP
jgi:replication factor A1